MKELLLLRHAKSSWASPGMPDFERPLNKRGRRAAVDMARYLADKGASPRLILSSDSKRTQETLAPIREALSSVSVRLEPKLYLADPRTLLACLRKVPDDIPSVLLIGHNPGLQELALELAETAGSEAVDGAARIEEKFPTAALARFRLKIDQWRELSLDRLDGAVTMLEYTTPTDLEPLGD